MQGRGTYRGIVDTKTHLELRIQELEKLLIIVYAKPRVACSAPRGAPVMKLRIFASLLTTFLLGLFYIA
jgi:hypothetical protein